MFNQAELNKACTRLMFIPLLLCLSGCTAVGEKTVSMSVVYGITTVLSMVLLIGYCGLIRKKQRWFFMLFGSVLIVNIGYFTLSISQDLSEALLANRISYFGSVFLPMSMLMIIFETVKIRSPKWIIGLLIGLGIIVFIIAASPGYLDIYYKEVSFVKINDVAMLHKVYGPLHGLYLYYLLGYFGVMLTVIAYAGVTGKLESGIYAAVLLIAVFVNICVWLLEQMVKIEFEFLSVSYIISELFLLGLYLAMQENQRLRDLIAVQEKLDDHAGEKANCIENVIHDETLLNENPVEMQEDFNQYLKGIEGLTPTERAVFELYVSEKSTKEIMSILNIKENTLKFHNKNIYGKLGVSSRKQLMATYRKLKERNLIDV